MNTGIIKKTATTAAAAATVVAGLSFASVDQAQAGGKHFWAGVGAGVVTGIVINEAVRHRRGHGHYYYDAPRHTSWDAHVAWCYDRYISYSHVDNRYTTHSGKRRRCNSPYL